MTRPTELREMDDGELLERLESAKEELFNLRFQMATGQLDNPMLIKTTRHDIARIMTVLRERELEALEADEALEAEEPRAADEAEAEEAS